MATETVRDSRLRSRPRWLPILLASGIAGLSMYVAWRTTSLDGLPDVGDPFDVAAFADRKVADADNAYVLYKEAVTLLTQQYPESTYDWPKADDATRRWLEENRPAMEVWRRGTERPEAQYVPPRSMKLDTLLPVVQELRKFPRLAQLEGSRLESEGDMEGAWRWHRAIFRSSRHVGRRGMWIERLVGISFHSIAVRQLSKWAADPRVDAALLRKALDAAIADDSLTSLTSDHWKVEYISFANSENDSTLMVKCLIDEDLVAAARPSPIGKIPYAFQLQRVLLKEPERSRRVLRLILANVLNWADLPSKDRPPIAVSVPNSVMGARVKTLFDLREVGASAPSAARALPPEELASWFQSSLYARHLLPSINSLDAAIARERSAQAQLLLTLANQLFAREHGHPPETLEELVGPYLIELPEGLPSTGDTPEPRAQP
ncbi:hypothetical protein P12x_003479 [Tundrisphaera lichenicola]|uniref:hypothetical protein n=1 Tax=Tundrisphaera lichenicola TaxID=2029860 RepID=UPI003EC0BDDF